MAVLAMRTVAGPARRWGGLRGRRLNSRGGQSVSFGIGGHDVQRIVGEPGFQRKFAHGEAKVDAAPVSIGSDCGCSPLAQIVIRGRDMTRYRIVRSDVTMSARAA